MTSPTTSADAAKVLRDALSDPSRRCCCIDANEAPSMTEVEQALETLAACAQHAEAGAVDLWVRDSEKDGCSDGCCGGCAFTRFHPAQPASQQGEKVGIDSSGVTITEGDWTGTYAEWRAKHALSHPAGDKVRVTDAMVEAGLKAVPKSFHTSLTVEEYLLDGGRKYWSPGSWHWPPTKQALVLRAAIETALDQEKNDGR
jgi:hypothetical protein